MYCCSILKNQLSNIHLHSYWHNKELTLSDSGWLLNSFWKKQGFLASRRVILLVYTKREWRWSFFYLNNFHPRYIVKQGIDKTWLKIAYFGKSPLDRKKSFRFYAARITPKHWLLNNALTPSHIWKGKKLLTEVHTNHW